MEFIAHKQIGTGKEKVLVMHNWMGDSGKPMDQATAALFLASEESSWMTGQIMTVDGGQSLSF